MNRISHRQRVQVLRALLDGMSMRAAVRLTGVSINAVKRLLIQAGEVAADYHDTRVRGVQAKYVECDEIWSFIYAKRHTILAGRMKRQTEKAGDMYTWTAIDSESKLIISYLVGGRGQGFASAFMIDLDSRMATERVQMTTDGYPPYIGAVQEAFGKRIDYAMDKGFGDKEIISGWPDEAHISTTFVEHQNLTMRMCMRRFTRSTNGFSKKAERHVAMVCLYFLYYNFCRVHGSVRVTPAMEAGIDPVAHDVDWIAELVEQSYPAPGPRGPYRSRKK